MSLSLHSLSVSLSLSLVRIGRGLRAIESNLHLWYNKPLRKLGHGRPFPMGRS